MRKRKTNRWVPVKLKLHLFARIDKSSKINYNILRFNFSLSKLKKDYQGIVAQSRNENKTSEGESWGFGNGWDRIGSCCQWGIVVSCVFERVLALVVRFVDSVHGILAVS